MRRALARAVPAVVAAVLVAGSAVWSPVPADAQPVAPVTMTVADVVPNSPHVTHKPKQLTFTVLLVNHTDQSLRVTTITAARSDPIGSQEGLDSAIAHPRPPSVDGVSPLSASAKNIILPPNRPVTEPITTTTDVFVHDGVCLCADLIYPFWFIASYSGPTGSGTATAQTFVPSFTKNPEHKATVSWVWPLLDRPHRLLQSKIFFDDSLATEVADNGRLDRLLQVIEQVSPDVPMTIVTDPDLIDELAQMEQGYKVSTPQGLVDGTGADAAKQWLTRLAHVLDLHPNVTVEFTPSADPAVDSLTHAGLDWSVAMDPKEQATVTHALGRTPGHDLVWPVGRSLSPATLAALLGKGAGTVLVSDSSLTGGDVQPVPDALAPIPGSSARFAVTSAPIQHLVDSALDPRTNGLALLPQLVAQLALRVETGQSRYVVIAPPRDLDVDPATAARVIEATANTTWSQPITIEQAVSDKAISATDRGTLRATAHGPRLPHRLLHSLRQIGNQIPLVETMFHDQSVGQALFARYPTAIQRAESTSLITDPTVGLAMADRLESVIRATKHSVYIVRPSDGTYTLTSKNSQLPITVVNRLNTEVDVEILVDPVGGSSGLSARTAPQVYTLKANSKVQVHVATHVDRVGLIGVVVRIRTPGGLVLGRPVHLSVRSTALGTIGVIITVLAAILLVVAVVIRQVRRLRRRTPRAPDEPTPVTASTASAT